MRLFRAPAKVVADVKAILHLPLFERLLHHKSRRPVVVVGVGTILMVLGSLIASNRHELAHYVLVHHLFFDTFGYFLHAVGALPALRYIEPFWLILLGAAEETTG